MELDLNFKVISVNLMNLLSISYSFSVRKTSDVQQFLLFKSQNDSLSVNCEAIKYEDFSC